jgi:hypothetical protein
LSEPKWSVRVRTVYESSATVHAGRHKLSVGPAAAPDEAQAPAALNLLLTALGGDLIHGFRQAAVRNRIELFELEFKADLRLYNPLVALGVIGEADNPRIREIVGTLYVAADSSRESLESIWQQALARSPIVPALRAGVDLRLDWRAL